MGNHRRKVLTRLLAEMQTGDAAPAETALAEFTEPYSEVGGAVNAREAFDDPPEEERPGRLEHSGPILVSASDLLSAPPVPASDPLSNPTASGGGWVVSVAFWLFLIVAAGLYSAAALAAPMLETLELESQQRAQHQRLIAMEHQNQQLQKTIHALKTDPRVAEELARQDFHALRAESPIERLPVDGTLAHAPAGKSPELFLASPALPWYAPLLKLAGKNQSINTSLLICAGSLVLYAFGFLRPS